MRRVILLILILLPFWLSAQNAAVIKSDPAFLWAEGSGKDLSEAENRAVDALLVKLSDTDYLPVDKSLRLPLWRTYRSDLIAVSKSIHDGAYVLRYIEWSRISAVFSPRQRRVRELLESARSAPADLARTYLDWAEAYMTSLPKDPALAAKITELKSSKGNGPLADPRGLGHIRREVESIRALLSTPSGGNTVASAAVTGGRGKVVTVKEHQEVPSSGGNAGGRPFTRTGREAQGAPGLLPLEPALALPTKLEVPSPGLARPAERLVEHDPSTGCRDRESFKYRQRLYITAQVGCGYGLGIGYRWGSLGAYASARSDFGGVKSEYSCRQDGTTDFGFIWASGESRRGRYSFAAGGIVALSKSLNLTIGAGYGSDSTFWEDTSVRWSRVEDLSNRGVLLEAGAMYSFKWLTLQAGCSLIELKKACPFVGIGVNLGCHGR